MLSGLHRNTKTFSKLCFWLASNVLFLNVVSPPFHFHLCLPPHHLGLNGFKTHFFVSDNLFLHSFTPLALISVLRFLHASLRPALTCAVAYAVTLVFKVGSRTGLLSTYTSDHIIVSLLSLLWSDWSMNSALCNIEETILFKKSKKWGEALSHYVVFFPREAIAKWTGRETSGECPLYGLWPEIWFSHIFSD